MKLIYISSNIFKIDPLTAQRTSAAIDCVSHRAPTENERGHRSNPPANIVNTVLNVVEQAVRIRILMKCVRPPREQYLHRSNLSIAR